ncbi:MAG: hypothetical protein OXE78_06380 [Gammaproteobacteria bacterium]|nr:hypothetical protein [Gammaproteobacteria bacterium]MCY4357485.1 hypothetical protein [Gammaproteobacteria bacterium]
MRKINTGKALKFAHIIGSTGFCAALLALLVLHASLPEPSKLEQFAMLRITMGNVVKWLLLPSTALVVLSGLFAMALNDIYKSAGWVWLKLATGVLILEGTLVYVQAPMERAGREGVAALAGEFDFISIGAILAAERNSAWVILGVALVNIVLGVYRPRLSRRNPN